MSDYVTGFHTKDGVKKYDYRSLANLPESGTDITNTVISPNADFAEVGEWADGNPNREDRLGYFVAIAEVGDNTIKIRKATSEDDVRGVSVYNPAFSGNAARNKYGADGDLLPQYNYIGVMGIVKVIDNGRCSVGGRCMPADDGTAKSSSNNMGYAVLERVDRTHVLIAVEPGADMIQRVRTDIKIIEELLENGGASPNISVEEIEGGHRVTITKPDDTVLSFDVMNGKDAESSGSGLTDEQLEQFNTLVQWHAASTYKRMTVSLSPASSIYEIGYKADIKFTWSFSHDVSSVTFAGSAQAASKEGSATITGISNTSVFKVIGTRADGNKETADAEANVYFYNKYYLGCAADPGSIDSSLIKALTTRSDWAISRPTFTLRDKVNCTANNHIWFAYPARLGTSSFKINGFSGSFKEPQLVAFTNNFGYKEAYYVYQSIEHSLGLIDELQVL